MMVACKLSHMHVPLLITYRISGNFDVVKTLANSHSQHFGEINFDELQKTLKQRCL